MLRGTLENSKMRTICDNVERRETYTGRKLEMTRSASSGVGGEYFSLGGTACDDKAGDTSSVGWKSGTNFALEWHFEGKKGEMEKRENSDRFRMLEAWELWKWINRSRSVWNYFTFEHSTKIQFHFVLVGGILLAKGGEGKKAVIRSTCCPHSRFGPSTPRRKSPMHILLLFDSLNRK